MLWRVYRPKAAGVGLCDPHIQLLVLAEFDEHDEAESFVLALQTMDSAVRTFEAMLLMRCNSFERPWCALNVAALEASCTDNTRSSRCTVLNCSSGIDWPEILPVVASMVGRTFTHVLYIAAGHRVDVADFGSFLSGTCWGTMYLLRRYSSISFQGIASVTS